MSAALPPGSMVGTETGLHQWTNTPSLESHVWSSWQCFQTHGTLAPKCHELCDYIYAQKGGVQGGWGDGIAPSFQCSWSTYLDTSHFHTQTSHWTPTHFTWSHLINWPWPSHPELSTDAPEWTPSNIPSESGKGVPLQPFSWLEPLIFEHNYNHTFHIIQESKALEFRSIADCSKQDFLRRECWSIGVNLSLYPPCCLGAVLLTSEWCLLTVE